MREITMFFPAYNEEENLPKLIKSAEKVLKKAADKYEIIIVQYEGATDNSIKITKEHQKTNKRLRLIIQPKEKKGMGIALKMGFEAAKYPLIFYADADNQFNLEEFRRFLPYIDDYDIIAGYRIKRQDPMSRLIASKLYNIIVKSIFNVKERDVDCAFRLVKKKVIKDIKLACKTGLATTELLAKARKKGFKIKEVGVTHYPRLSGKPIFTNSLNLPKPKVIKGLLKEMMALKRELR